MKTLKIKRPLPDIPVGVPPPNSLPTVMFTLWALISNYAERKNKSHKTEEYQVAIGRAQNGQIRAKILLVCNRNRQEA